MFILYDLIFILFALCILPTYIFKRKFHQGFLMRLGIFSDEQKKCLAGARPIWLHAVSVGEVLASKALLEELRKAYPHTQIVISTVTSTGNKIAKKIACAKDFVFYLPFDIRFIVKKVVSLINPSLVIIAETEIWPNLISCLYRRRVPVVTVNARISDGSFKGYRLVKFLIKPVMNKISVFCVQSESDGNRLAALGVAREKIYVTGNMKFDNAEPQSAQINDKGALADYADKRLKLGLQDKDMLWVAGSTHPGEEEIVVRVYKELLKEFQDLKLLIAPRHPERAREVERVVGNCGLNHVLVSQLAGEPVSGLAGLPVSRLSPLTRLPAYPLTVFILDTIGQLKDFYAASDIVFIGGSLIKKGGQNILEPAALAKPILCGPYMFNFRDITALFLKNEACRIVQDKEALQKDMADLLNNSSKADALGKRARELIVAQKGATRRNIAYINKLISEFNSFH